MAGDVTKTAAPLLAALNLAAAIVEGRSTIPILENARLKSDGKGIVISATDLDAEISVTVAQRGPAFDTTAGACVLRSIVDANGGAASFDMRDGKLEVSAGPLFTLPTLPADKAHVFEALKATAKFDLPAAQLLADLQAVRSAISYEETRYYLNGVYWHLTAGGGKLALAATDGHRLCRVQREPPKGAEKLTGSIVPRKAVRLLIDALAASSATSVRCEFGENKARFTVGDVTILTKLVDGVYPDYTRVIPTEGFSGALTVDGAELAALLEQAMIVKEQRKTVASLDFAEKAVRGANNSAAGTMTAPMPGDVTGTPPSVVGVNPAYLVSILAARPGEKYTLHLSDMAAPILVTCTDETFVAVLMPMRL